jgi:hypothetical protein
VKREGRDDRADRAACPEAIPRDLRNPDLRACLLTDRISGAAVDDEICLFSSERL